MRTLLILCVLWLALTVSAASRISMTVTVTNVPVTSNTFTVNGATRTWTNASSSTTILTNLVGLGPSATNLFDNYSSYTVGSGIIVRWLGTNQMRFEAPLGISLSGSATGSWATVTMTTQSGPSTFTALWPLENMVGETNRTNQGSALVYGLGIYSTNAFPTNATALSNFITKGASAEQIVSTPLTVVGTLRSRAALFATNGFTSALTNINPVFSNAVNYGNALRSPGPYPNSDQFGSGAQVSAGNSLAIGYSAIAATNGTSVGPLAGAGHYSVAVGSGADASPATNSIAIGQNSAVGAASNALAIGRSAAIGDRHHNSVAIGANSQSTTNDQIVLGASTHSVYVAGLLVGPSVTNATLRGTNVINGRLDFTAGNRTSLANGYNSGTVLGTNVYLRMSGPSSAYTNAGFAAAVDGTWHRLQFDNPGLSYTILHDSGLDATAANRVYTGTGALINSTNNPAFLELIYDGVVSRWRVMSFR